MHFEVYFERLFNIFQKKYLEILGSMRGTNDKNSEIVSGIAAGNGGCGGDTSGNSKRC